MSDPAQDGPIAAVDLGSNSFHMVVGRVLGEQVSLVDRLREPVRLAAGLRPDGSLDPETVERALACLARFAERLRDVPPARLRVVGTNTLRQAERAGAFLSAARKVLGVPVEILPGAEEARLIYLGVAHDVELASGRRLVVDIGGGSTECILGEGFEALATSSLDMGCVTYSERFFGDGRVTRDAFRRAELAARQELEPIERAYGRAGRRDAIGASGTIRAVETILRASGFAEAHVPLDGVKRLRRALIDAGSVAAIALPGLSEDRRPVLCGGVAILKAVFEAFDLERLRTSDYALREGLLYDLLGRFEETDVRERTVEAMARRYEVDLEQAARVELTALDLFRHVHAAWDLDPRRGTRALRWASRLLEVGLALSYSGHHKHGAYVVANSTMPGFAREDRALLAALVRNHRRRIDLDVFRALPPYHREAGFRLCVLLRVAVCLNRRRGGTELPALRARAAGDELALELPPGWLAEQPLTSADLAAESASLLAAGIRFHAT